MIKPNSRMTYEQFIKLSLQQRKIMAEYFFKNKVGCIPVILNKRSVDLPQLKNCKFLFNQNNELYGQLTSLRQFIIRNSSNKLTKDQQLFFFHRARLLNSNQKVKAFYQKVKGELQDGWLYISYQKQATFGGSSEKSQHIQEALSQNQQKEKQFFTQNLNYM